MSAVSVDDYVDEPVDPVVGDLDRFRVLRGGARDAAFVEVEREIRRLLAVQAAMVAENRRLAAPASVDSLPTSAMQEDHVSMGWGAARKLRQSVANLARIIACEAVCAARGIELRQPVEPAAPTAAAVAALRSAGVPGAGPDRWLSPELARAEALVASGELLAAVERVTGPLD